MCRGGVYPRPSRGAATEKWRQTLWLRACRIGLSVTESEIVVENKVGEI